MSKLIGNAIVGQSGGPTAAINATLAGVVRGVIENVHDGSIKTLYGMKNGALKMIPPGSAFILRLGLAVAAVVGAAMMIFLYLCRDCHVSE